MSIKVEYLITYNIKGSTLQTTDNYKYLLMSNALISFNDENQLVFEDVIFNFELLKHEIIDKNQRIFKVNISCEDLLLIDKMSELLKIIREFTFKTEGKTTILWDEISNHYSSLAYPEINKIENLLRKLITYFMITNFGFEWTEESIPLDLKNGVKKNRDKNNFLHDTDFIQLSDFLFKPYSSKNIDLLFKDIKDKKIGEIIDYKYFNQFVPKSNWERYFNAFVDYEDGNLSKKWNQLYELRCLIAHNNFLTKKDYKNIIDLVNELSEKFNQAIEFVNKIIIPKNEKEAVLESVLKAHNEKFSLFLREWQEITQEINNLAKKHNIEHSTEEPLSETIQKLIKNNIVTEQFYSELKPIGEFRNRINDLNEIFSDSEINEYYTLAADFFVLKFVLADDTII